MLLAYGKPLRGRKNAHTRVDSPTLSIAQMSEWRRSESPALPTGCCCGEWMTRQLFRAEKTVSGKGIGAQCQAMSFGSRTLCVPLSHNIPAHGRCSCPALASDSLHQHQPLRSKFARHSPPARRKMQSASLYIGPRYTSFRRRRGKFRGWMRLDQSIIDSDGISMRTSCHFGGVSALLQGGC